MKTKKEDHQAKAAEFATQVVTVLTGFTNGHLGDYMVTIPTDPQVIRDAHTGAFTHYLATFVIDSSIEGTIAVATFISDGTAIVSPGTTGIVTHLSAFCTIRTML